MSLRAVCVFWLNDAEQSSSCSVLLSAAAAVAIGSIVVSVTAAAVETTA